MQAVAVMRELGIEPTGSTCTAAPSRSATRSARSGARVLTTLLYALKRRNLKRGIAALCLGGGNGVALAVRTSLRCKVPRMQCKCRMPSAEGSAKS